ncbi:MAG: hypothetical protein GX896_04280 [Clostridiales bacterium]|nr:hypothetical protein [Clostridiales bacterium]
MKRTLSLLFVVLMSLSLGSCKKDSSSKDSKNPPQDNSSAGIIDNSITDDTSKNLNDNSNISDSTNINNDNGLVLVSFHNLSIELPKAWTNKSSSSACYYFPADYTTTGNNLCIKIIDKIESFEYFTEDFIKGKNPNHKIKVTSLSEIDINGCHALRAVYNVGELAITTSQYYITGSKETYVVTFTGNYGDFYLTKNYAETIKVG